MSLFGKKKKKCLKCDSTDLAIEKPGLYRKMQDQLYLAWRKPTKNLNVCKSCGFSWEDRYSE